MDRNLTERLKKLSKELAASEARLHDGNALTDEERESLIDRIEDIQDELWDVEEQLREEAQGEYDDHSAKGWN